MTDYEGFYQLLFEVSHETRHQIILLLEEKAMRITYISKALNLNHPESRRHIIRLRDIGFIKRDDDGYYHLTSYGKASVLLFQELEFLTANSSYFESHSLLDIPSKYVKRIGELRGSSKVDEVISFINHTETLIKESKKYVWLLVDQFPIHSLTIIVEAIERGVQFRIIEPKDRVFIPDIDIVTSEETRTLSKARNTPLVDQKIVDSTNVFLYVSDSGIVVAFPSTTGQFDYKGFTSDDDSSNNWCRELYQHYWDTAEPGGYTHSTQIRGTLTSEVDTTEERIIVTGQESPEIDRYAVQHAVDNYPEVIMKGVFNFGPSAVIITKSVTIKGDGREDGTPSTKIYKKGWSFPHRDFDPVFSVGGEGIDVVIENIHFTDFNIACIQNTGPIKSNSLKILNNRITLITGYGRGITYGSFGDLLHGILAEHIGDGGVLIEGNYIDLALGGIWRGNISRGGREEDPEYRPDLFNHEYYMGFGIAVNSCSGRVQIINNTVRNANGRGIAVSGHTETAMVEIKNNIIESDVYGSYPFSSNESGAGIVAHTGLEREKPGFKVEVEENTIKLDKLNYSGIVVLGPSAEKSGKLKDGVIKSNKIHLGNGYEGIHVRKNDGFTVANNTIAGETYYGIRVSGRKDYKGMDLKAASNFIENNDMSNLLVKNPNDYSNNHADGRQFSEKQGRSMTAHVWLNTYSENNIVKLGENESYIDEGNGNQIKK